MFITHLNRLYAPADPLCYLDLFDLSLPGLVLRVLPLLTHRSTIEIFVWCRVVFSLLAVVQSNTSEGVD